jgi:predicted RecA/RadA family phage recombinase
MRNYLGRGDIVPVPAPYDVPSGGGVLIGAGLFGIAASDASSGAEVELQMVGVFRLPKAAPDAFAIGDAVYWSDADRLATAVPGPPEAAPIAREEGDPGNLRIGWCVASADADGPTVDVRLNGPW